MPTVAIMIYELLRGILISDMFDGDDVENLVRSIEMDDEFAPWNYQGIAGQADAVENDILQAIIADRHFEDVAEHVNVLWALMKSCYHKKASDVWLTSRQLRTQLEKLIVNVEKDARTNDEFGAMDLDDAGDRHNTASLLPKKKPTSLAPPRRNTV